MQHFRRHQGLSIGEDAELSNASEKMFRCGQSKTNLFYHFFYSVIVMFDDILECECVNVTFSEIINSLKIIFFAMF